LKPYQVEALLISQKGLDNPENYRLFYLDDGAAIPLHYEEIAFQRQLRLAPDKPLDAGTYVLDIPAGGMFAGREYYYFRLDPVATDLPTTASWPGHGTAASP
jgi:hypothetical protein